MSVYYTLVLHLSQSPQVSLLVLYRPLRRSGVVWLAGSVIPAPGIIMLLGSSLQAGALGSYAPMLCGGTHHVAG
jgi:hypothetical protein